MTRVLSDAGRKHTERQKQRQDRDRERISKVRTFGDSFENFSKPSVSFFVCAKRRNRAKQGSRRNVLTTWDLRGIVFLGNVFSN